MLEALAKATTNRIFSIAPPGKAAATLAKALLSADLPNMYAQQLAEMVWPSITAGDEKNFTSAGYDMMWKTLHQLKLSEEYNTWWQQLCSMLTGFNFNEGSKQLLGQNFLRSYVECLIKARNTVDGSQHDMTPVDKTVALTEEEQKALRYVAGYVPVVLIKHFKRYPSNTAAQVYIDLLSQWKVDCDYEQTETDQSLLEYTKSWVNRVNRGGLFVVHDDVFEFFKLMEQSVKPVLQKDFTESHKDINLKGHLVQTVRSTDEIMNAWCKITTDIQMNDKLNSILFDKVITRYINLRCNSFVASYMYIRKMENKSVSRKGEQSLRSQLASRLNAKSK